MPTAAKKKTEPDTPVDEGSPLPTSFKFTCPGREVTEQINLRIPSEHGGARLAAVACFNAIYDAGSNSPTTVELEQLPDSITVKVSQSDYVHGE